MIRSIHVAAALLGLLVAASYVYGNAPPARYSIPMTGLVLDNRTGLTWEATVDPGAYSYSDAAARCAALSTGAGKFRLPSVKELLTLVDFSRSSPAIDPVYFPDTPPAWFWSSSPVAGKPKYAWDVYFVDGSTGEGLLTASARVRCVH